MIRRILTIVFTLLLLIQESSLATEATSAKGSSVHANAHSHNDYYRERPLLDALEKGFGSVEADVFLLNDELLVAHSLFEIRLGRTLESLYLEPLKARCQNNGGRVYRDGPELTLLIDIKTDAESTYAKLSDTLAKYDSMFDYWLMGK